MGGNSYKVSRCGATLSGVLLLLLGLLLTPACLSAQSAQQRINYTASAATQSDNRRSNQIAIDAGLLSLGLTYSRRLPATAWSIGAGLWGAWEPPSTFGQNVWEPIGIVLLSRYNPRSWLHTDLGFTAARYLWADDCSECTGTLLGVRAEAYAGRGIFFLGPQLLIGHASSDRHGSELGLILGGHLRVLVGWE